MINITTKTAENFKPPTVKVLAQKYGCEAEVRERTINQTNAQFSHRIQKALIAKQHGQYPF